MTVTRNYVYLGEIQGPGLAVPLKLFLGHYAAASGDAYPLATTKVSFLFPGLSQVMQVLNLYADMAANVANLLALSEFIAYARALDAAAFTDDDDAANEATANDMTLLPSDAEAEDMYYFGSSYPFNGMHLRVTTQGNFVGTLVWEYYNGSAWVEVPGLVDGTVGFTAAAGLHKIAFRAPGDWSTVAINTVTCYWLRARVTAVTSISTSPAAGQAFLRDRGNVVQAAVLESGGDGASFDEKPAETYGQAVNFYCLVAGI